MQHGAGSECSPDSAFSFDCAVFLHGFDSFGLYCRICFCISFIIHSIQTVYLNLSGFIFLFCADCVSSLFSIWCSLIQPSLMFLCISFTLFLFCLFLLLLLSKLYFHMEKMTGYFLIKFQLCFFASLVFKVIHKVSHILSYFFGFVI